MIKKLVFSLSLITLFGLIIVKINSDFTFNGFLSRLGNFPNLKDSLRSVSFPNPPQISVPNVNGFKQVVSAINSVLEGLFSLAEFSIALVKVTPQLLKNLFELITYTFGLR